MPFRSGDSARHHLPLAAHFDALKFYFSQYDWSYQPTLNRHSIRADNGWYNLQRFTSRGLAAICKQS